MKTPEGATLLGQGATFRGHLSSTGEVVIQGRFEGTIEAAQSRVTVAEGASVRAAISAQEVVVMGAVEGDIRASGRADLRHTARMKGDIFARRLAMEPEAVLQGRVDPEAGPTASSGTAASDAPGKAESSKGAAVTAASVGGERLRNSEPGA